MDTSLLPSANFVFLTDEQYRNTQVDNNTFYFITDKSEIRFEHKTYMMPAEILQYDPNATKYNSNTIYKDVSTGDYYYSDNEGKILPMSKHILYKDILEDNQSNGVTGKSIYNYINTRKADFVPKTKITEYTYNPKKNLINGISINQDNSDLTVSYADNTTKIVQTTIPMKNDYIVSGEVDATNGMLNLKYSNNGGTSIDLTDLVKQNTLNPEVSTNFLGSINTNNSILQYMLLSALPQNQLSNNKDGLFCPFPMPKVHTTARNILSAGADGNLTDSKISLDTLVSELKLPQIDYSNYISPIKDKYSFCRGSDFKNGKNKVYEDYHRLGTEPLDEQCLLRARDLFIFLDNKDKLTKLNLMTLKAHNTYNKSNIGTATPFVDTFGIMQTYKDTVFLSLELSDYSAMSKEDYWKMMMFYGGIRLKSIGYGIYECTLDHLPSNVVKIFGKGDESVGVNTTFLVMVIGLMNTLGYTTDGKKFTNDVSLMIGDADIEINLYYTKDTKAKFDLTVPSFPYRKD